MWGGRFSDRPDAIMEEINVSIDVDRHLYAQDIEASKAHAAMLAAQGIITAADAKKIARGHLPQKMSSSATARNWFALLTWDMRRTCWGESAPSY